MLPVGDPGSKGLQQGSPVSQETALGKSPRTLVEAGAHQVPTPSGPYSPPSLLPGPALGKMTPWANLCFGALTLAGKAPLISLAPMGSPTPARSSHLCPPPYASSLSCHAALLPCTLHPLCLATPMPSCLTLWLWWLGHRPSLSSPKAGPGCSSSPKTPARGWGSWAVLRAPYAT